MTLTALSWRAWAGAVVALALLVVLVVVGVAIVRRFRQRKITLNQWLAEVPQGSFKLLVATALALIVTVSVTGAPLAEALLCMARWQWFPDVPTSVACTHLEIPEGALWAIVAIIAGFAGFSSMDFRTKRTTYVPGANGPDIEDVKAGATGEMKAAPAKLFAAEKDGRTLPVDDPLRGVDAEGQPL